MATSIPVTTDIGDLSTLSVSAATKTVLDAKYTDALAWATWAAQLLQQNITDTTNLLKSNTIDTDLDQLTTDLNNYLTPPTVTQYSGINSFNDSFVTALREKVLHDINNPGTGLGDAAEAAIFARDQARVLAERAIAYSELVDQFSSFPAPTGQMLAKITEVSNETSRRLADSSAEILKLSAQLQQDTNKSTLATGIQLLGIIAEIFNNEEVRKFEAYKTVVMTELDSYKSSLELFKTRSDIVLKKAEIDLDAKTKQLTVQVEVIRGLAQSASQMVASALNSVNVSSSLGFSGNISDSTSTSESVQHIFEGV